MARPRIPLADRFWAKTEKAGDCWLWTGGIMSSGYGSFTKGRSYAMPRCVLAHRMAWILTYGEIPRGDGYHGICVCHRCDVKRCVNPAHLFLGTNAENVTDRNNKGRQSKGERNGAAKLTSDKVLAIRSDSRTHRLIALDYGVSENVIGQVKRRTIWVHVQELAG